LNGSAPNLPSRSPLPPSPPREPTDPTASTWKTEVSDRVRAHRNRSRRTPSDQPLLPGMEDALSPSSIAARVAERYSRVPSWRAWLVAQAAAQKSAAEASAASTEASAPPASIVTPAQLDPTTPPPEAQAAPPSPDPEPHQPDLLRYSVSMDSLPAPRTTPAEARAEAKTFRQIPDVDPNLKDPLEEAFVEPAQPLPARVLAFPRELVAPRKARPRLAEGPLGEDGLIPAALIAVPPPDATTAPEARRLAEGRQPVPHSPAGETELRIPAPASEPASPLPKPSAQVPPEWRSIHLDTEAPIRDSNPSPSLLDGPRLHVASLEDRALAAFVDCSFILSAFLLFSLIFAICTTSLPHGRPALIGACLTLFAMWVLYQLLFFSLTNATPGMRYAKIALCTFSDKNPTHSVLRTRIAAVLLSALPLGLGFLWAVFDEDSLGWHDRITQTYQRSYQER
jgi:uncharacterized RDD family membrane protein YckC